MLPLLHRMQFLMSLMTTAAHCPRRNGTFVSGKSTG